MSNPQSKTPSPTHPPNPNPIITFSGHPIHSLTDLHEAIGTCLAMSTLSPSVFTPASGFTLYGNPVSVVDISKFAVQLEAIKEGRVPSILKPVEIRVPEESLHRLSWGTAKHLEDLSGQQGPGFQGNALCSKPAIQPSPTPSGHLDNPTPSGNSLKNAVERNPGYGQPLQAAPSQPTPSQRHLNNPLVSSGNSKKNAVERNPGYSQPALHATPSQPTPSQRHLNNPLGSSGNSKKNAVERNPGYSQPALQATPSQPTPSQRRDHVDNFIPLLLSGNTISKDASVESNPGYSQPAYNGSRPHFQSQRVMSQPSISISQSALNANAVTPPHFQSDGASRQSTTNVMTGYMDAATCQQPTLTRDNERESSSSSSDPRYHTTTASHLKPQPSMDLQNESAYAGSMSNVGAHPHRRGYTQREITQYINKNTLWVRKTVPV
ncbi:hypothetical protein BC829DRAFT_178973 [Chytridium lagenaria]|nr:hypothetical protein BC829DRAFT_178973 [Chytridium lagenaria]